MLFCSLTIFLEPSLFDHASIADDADARQLQVLFAELNQLPHKLAFIVQERLPSRKVDLFHAWCNNIYIKKHFKLLSLK